MAEIQHTRIFGDLIIYCTLEYESASPGNPDPESPTCCPPSPAAADLVSVKVGGWNGTEIFTVLSDDLARLIEEEVICSLS